MGWQERDYERSVNYGGNPFSHPFWKLIFGSLYIGTLFRIRIRIHASLLWYAGLTMAFAGTGWRDAGISCLMLFGLVLLHEFGHCFACRWVGGQAEDILMWILGGLAFCDPPRRPWPKFVTVAGGPLVNVIIAVVLTLVIIFGYHTIPPLNPLFTFVPSILNRYIDTHDDFWNLYASKSGWYIFWLYAVNWSLLFFNLVPLYPLDGGQLLQTILWKPLGYVRSMKIVCYIGLVASPLLAILGFFTSMFLVAIAAFAFFGCRQQLQILRMSAAEEEENPYDLSAAWDNSDPPSRPKKRKKRWINTARKRALQDQAEQAKIDAILAKVKEKGLHSLSWWEKRTLRKATERQRQQDVASRL